MTTEKRRIPLDVKICGVIFLAAVFLFVESRGYADKAAMFPGIMLVCTMILSAYIMVKSGLYEYRNRQVAPGSKPEKAKPPVDLKAVFALAGMTTLYAFAAPYMGFGLSSLLFLYAGALFFGERHKLLALGVSAATVVFVYAFFIYFLGVGIQFFPELS